MRDGNVKAPPGYLPCGALMHLGRLHNLCWITYTLRSGLFVWPSR